MLIIQINIKYLLSTIVHKNRQYLISTNLYNIDTNAGFTIQYFLPLLPILKSSSKAVFVLFLE